MNAREKLESLWNSKMETSYFNHRDKFIKVRQ